MDENNTLNNNQSNEENKDIKNDSVKPTSEVNSTNEQSTEDSTKKFNVNFSDELNEIPDYDLASTGNVKTKSGFSRIIAAIIIVGLSVILAFVIIFAGQDIFGINKEDKDLLVEIPQNSGVSAVAQVLQDKGVINSAFLFKLYTKLTKIETSFHDGTYSLNSNMPYSLLISELSKYSQSKEEVKVTFPEGYTVLEMAKVLEEKGVCKKDEFIEALQTVNFEYDFETKIPPNDLRFYQLEGYLFPDTYFFYKEDSPVNVAHKLLSTYSKRMTKELLDKADAVWLSQHELMTIASIVQKEAGKTEQMAKVASVYLNRLRNKETFSKLQADPTRDYANAIKKEMDVINQDVLNAYNTYEGLGLPPGPICNPGIEAIKAVLYPADTDYFYFCTNLKTGEFYYAKTLDEHNRNVKKAGLRK